MEAKESAFVVVGFSGADGCHDGGTEDHENERETEKEVVHMGNLGEAERFVTRAAIRES